MTATEASMADKRGEMAEEFRKVMRDLSVTAVQKGLITRALELHGTLQFSAGAREMRERCAAHLDDYRKAYDEDLCPSSTNIEDIDPDDRTRTSFRMGRFVLDNARRDIRALPLDPKEAQDAEG